MEPKDCILVTRAHNEQDYLPRFLEHNGAFFDAFIALIDRSDDQSYEILKNHPKCLYVVEKLKGNYDQVADWAVLKEAANAYNYEWMWFLDPDELISHAFLEEMKTIPYYATDISFRFLSLFPDEDHFISGNHLYAKIRLRRKLYRRLHNYGFSLAHHVLGHRTSLLPAFPSKSLGYHFHMLDEKRRIKRHELYTSNDPEDALANIGADAYDHIINVDECRYLPCKRGNEWVPTTGDLCLYLSELQKDEVIERDIKELIATIRFTKVDSNKRDKNFDQY